MLLHRTQKLVAQSLNRFRVISCGRRWGKTTEAIEEAKGKALSKPCKIAYIAPTYAQARDIAWSMLLKELKPIIKKSNESRLELEVMSQTGESSFITLRGWENIETLRGQQYDLIIIDEVASMRNFWSNWQEVIRPTLTDTRGEAIFISTPKGFNHFYELFNLQDKDTDFKSFHFTSYDNPHIPKDELDKARKELTEDRFAQEYLADFRKTEGLVYKEFDRTIHLTDEEPVSVIETIAGVDFGFTNPCSVLTIKRNYDNTFYVTDEYYKTGKTDASIAEYVSSMMFNKVYADPENAGGIQELINRKVNVCEVIKGKGSVAQGINKVRELFKSGKLKINKRCVNLIWELETYSYPEKRDLHNPDENPIKENDHAVDSLRYPLMMISESYRQQVKTFTPKPMLYGQGYGSYLQKQL